MMVSNSRYSYRTANRRSSFSGHWFRYISAAVLFTAVLVMGSFPVHTQESGSGIYRIKPELKFGLPVNDSVRTEALRANGDTEGRQLPLAAHWHRNTLPLSYQIDLINQGYPILPWMPYSRSMSADRVQNDHGDALAVLRSWNMPLVLLYGNQWDGAFYSSEYADEPIENTGCGMNLDGTRMKKNSPLSPIQPWHDLGVKWSDNECVHTIESLYPDPPLVIFMSNNETARLRWHKAETSRRFVDLYGTEQDGEFKRRVFGDGWIERYSALFQGMRNGLIEQAWIDNSRYVGYNAYGPDHFGRWSAWKSYSLTTEDRIAWEPLAWDGAVPEVYDNDWEPSKTAFSMWNLSTEAMNLAFIQKEAFAQNPSFWFEFITWDGYTWERNNTKRRIHDYAGVEYTPEYYQGWTQYCLWLLTPRVMREWRGSSDPKDDWYPFFETMLKSVKRVHDSDVLTRFWRKGELVRNPEDRHLFQFSIPEKWKEVDRWYHLSTDCDPAINWRSDGGNSLKYDGTFPVWTMARVIGDAPDREWLVYAFAPLGEKKNVSVKIPEYGIIKLDTISVGGSFYLVVEDPDHQDDHFGAPGLRLYYTFDDADRTIGERSATSAITKYATISESQPDTPSPATIQVDETAGERTFVFLEIDLSGLSRELTRVDLKFGGTSLSGEDTEKPYIGAKIFADIDFDPAAATWNNPPVNISDNPEYDDIEGINDDETEWQFYLTRHIRAACESGASRILVAIYNVNDRYNSSSTDRTVIVSDPPQVTLYQGRGRDVLLDVSGNGFHADMASDDLSVDGIAGEGIDFVYEETYEDILLKPNVRNSFDIERLLDGGGTISFWVHGTRPSETYTNVISTGKGPEGWYVYNAGGTDNLRMKFITRHEDESIEWMSITPPADSIWHHIVFVVEKDLTVTGYLDGSLVDTRGPIINMPGRDGLGTTLNGKELIIDEMRLYDYSLSAAEVYDLYEDRGNTEPATGIFSVHPLNIESGQAVTLSWSSENAVYCIAEGFETLGQTEGSVTVYPEETTTYTLYTIGAGGTTRYTADVTVSDNNTSPFNESDSGGCTVSVSGTSAGCIFLIMLLTAAVLFVRRQPAAGSMVNGH